MSSDNGLVGTWFASRYWICKGTVGRGKATTPSSLSLTFNKVTTIRQTGHLITGVCDHGRLVL